MADVVLRSGLTYDRGRIQAALCEMIGAAGGWPRVFRAGARVLLKVNLLAAKSPDRAITTHPEVVGAVVELLRERGCRVFVGDSPGGPVRGVERYWRNCGLLDLAAELDFELVNFEASGSVPKDVNGTRYHIARPMFAYDALVNMCKFKTHMLCRLTCAVKNSFGAVPGLGKAMLHSYAPRPRDLAKHIVNIYSLFRFDLVIMDAILAMDGKGPSTDGNPREDGLLGVATDSVLLDMVMSTLVGLGPTEIDTTREARKRGFGKPWKEITVDGSYTFRDFRIPRTDFYNLVPTFVGSLLRPLMEKVPRSNEKCTACGICERTCPVDAITIADGRALMDRDTCIQCLCCHEMCPENAIDVQGSFRRR